MASDEELIESANGGDVDAFEALYYRYRDWVYQLARRFTGNHELALDVIQETFIYLVKKFPGFKLTAKMTSFLYPVVKHISFNIRRKNQRHISDDEVLAQLPAPPEHGTDRAELAEVLAVLSKTQREVLLMRYIDAMTIPEIAAALKTPAGTVKSRLHHALQILRRDNRTRNYFLE